MLSFGLSWVTCLASLASLALVLWLSVRSRPRHDACIARLDALASQSAEQARALSLELHSQMRLLASQLQTPAPPAPHPLTGLAFLPTEAGAAELERMILATEDRAITAGPSPSSSPPPTRPWGDRFGRRGSTRAARNSGAR